MKQNINIAVPMYNLIEYCDSYSVTDRQFTKNETERDHIPNN